MIRTALSVLLDRVTRPRRVHYARQLRALPTGTLLTFPGSSVAAVRFPNGWSITGRAGDDKLDEITRNLPARVARYGGGEAA